MGGNIVKLVFQSVLAGSGFAKVDEQTSMLLKKMGKMGQGAQILGRAFGDMGGVIGNAIGMLTQGGIWGAAASVATMAIGKCVDIFKEFKQTAEDARLAAQGMSREFMTLEAMASGYRKRVESYRKANEEAEKAEREAAEKRKKRSAEYDEKERKKVELAKAFAVAQEKIQQETLKVAQMSDKENESLRAKVKLILEVAKANVNAAEREVYYAVKKGDDHGMALAKLDLEVAKAQQKTAKATARKIVDDDRKKKEASEAASEEATDRKMIDLQRKEYIEKENQKKREQAAKAEGIIRKNYAEAIKKIEDEISAKRKEADVLEQNASRARGVGFGEWSRSERDLERKNRTEERKQKNRVASVDREIERLGTMNPKTMTKWQRDRLARLREWKADQDPNNNPAIKELKELEAKRDKLEKEKIKKLDELKKALDDVLTDLTKL